MANTNYNIRYNPKHHKAHSNGVVYEHIVVAEIVLGRELVDGEVVHHEDENKKNNSPENLIIFKTSEDHSRFHKTGIREKLDDGTYVSPKQFCTCLNCHIMFESSYTDANFCSLDCKYEKQRKVKNLPTKEELEKLLLDNNFVLVGKMFGVSDNAVRKWCTNYGLSKKAKDYKRA